MPKANEKLYRHYVDGHGAFRTECHIVTSLKLIPAAYSVKPEDGAGKAVDVPSSWINAPRAAELWTTDPDPDKAYKKLLDSAGKDLENARGRLAVYEALYEKLKNAERGDMPMNEKIAVTGGYASPASRYGKIVVMGRSQSGKTTVAKRLAELTGLTVLKTSTSRPRRTPDEDTYHFYTPEEAAAIPMERKLFHTLAVDGFERWTDLDDFLEAGIAVLDPTGAGPAVRLWQEQGYKVTVLYCGEPKEVRSARWMKEFAAGDGSDWDRTLVAFNHREMTEAPMFDAFEKTVRDIEEMYDADALLYPNASPEHRSAIGEDRLEQVRTSCTDMDGFLPRFLARLSGSGGLPSGGFRTFAQDGPIDLSPEGYTEQEWALLCRVFGLLPGTTYSIRVLCPSVQAYVHPGAAASVRFKEENHAGD